jgi:hypothetical protein
MGSKPDDLHDPNHEAAQYLRHLGTTSKALLPRRFLQAAIAILLPHLENFGLDTQ